MHLLNVFAKPSRISSGLGLGRQSRTFGCSKTPRRIPGALCMGVGAAFDILAGRVNRAPIWIRRIGLEWAYRVVQEPKRLWRRYAIVVPRFIVLVLAGIVTGRVR